MIPPVSQHINLHLTKARYQEATHSSPVIILISAWFDPINILVLLQFSSSLRLSSCSPAVCPSIFYHPQQSDFYIHAVFFSSQAQLRHLLLSAHAPMKLVIFDHQQILQVAAAPSVCIYEVTGCMHILRLYVFSLAFAAPQGTFQSQRSFWRVVRTPKTVLK